MNKKTLVYALALLIVAGSVGAISASAHSWGWGAGKALFSQEEVEAKIAEKVADGAITQEQADRKLQWMADKQAKHDEQVAEVAEFLGLSVEEFEAEIVSGKNPLEIAEAQGISEEAMRDFHKAHRLEMVQERLQAAVEAGKLTQEEADERLEQIESGEWDGRMHKGFGRKSYGKHNGFEGKRGFGFGE